jgi:hypothetical protein
MDRPRPDPDGWDVGGHRVVLHHALGRTAALLVPAIGLLATLPTGGSPERLRALAAVLAVTGVLVAVGWRPGVVIGDDAVVLRNPWRDVRLPWSSVDHVHMRWVLEVDAEGARHRAWGAPGPRRLRDMRDTDWTGDVVSRYALAGVESASRQGHGALGSADAGMLVGQRWAARGPLVPGAAVAVRPAVASRAVLAVAALLLAGSLVPW